jgi:3-oxoacyl-(acyl-carrier-protein) synthase
MSTARPASPIAITGLGGICAIGQNVAEIRTGLAQGRTGLAPLRRFDPLDLPASPVGEVGELPGDESQGSPTHRLAICAAREALTNSGLRRLPAAERVALVVGTTTGGISESEAWYLARLSGASPDPRRLSFHAASTIAHQLGRELGITGPRLTISTACSSGSNAITTATDLLRCGDVDLVIAGGADALTKITYFGFSSLRLMSATPCRPFDRQRNGLNLGEAAAFFVLEREKDARARGATIFGFVAGTSCTCDAHHITAPSPDGAVLADAIRGALDQAGLEADQVDYVNAHGTATPANDQAEARVLRRVFPNKMPPVSSSKSFLGHTLGAAGAIEALVCVLALNDGILPATLNTSDPDPEAPADLVLGRPRSATLIHTLSINLAFGGNNTALIFSRGDR